MRPATLRSPRHPLAAARRLLTAGVLAAAATACTRDTAGLDPAPFENDPLVFSGGFARNTDFQAFSGSDTEALSIDAATRRNDRSTLRVVVPDAGSYAGGAFVGTVPRDLTEYDALTFWARASREATLDVVGLGNDNTGTSQYTAEAGPLTIGTTWQKYVIPIPLAAKLTEEKGLFHFADGADEGVGYTLWFDDVRFEQVGTSRPRAELPSFTAIEEVGTVRRIAGFRVTYDVGGRDETVTAGPGYFTLTSSDPAVAVIREDGAISTVGAGTAMISATLGETPVAGAVTLRAFTPPTTAAPAPTQEAADVISLFSGAYQNVPVSTWSASYDQADVTDLTIAGDPVKKYSGLGFAAVEFTQPTIDASAMTMLHLDAYVIDDGAFRVKLVDFGADGAYGGGDDSEHEVTITGATSPAVTVGAWSSLDIPLSAFPGLTARAHLAQLILSGSSSTVYVDNVYLWRAPLPPPTAPTTAPPAPTYAAGDAIALLSAAYPNVTVDTWSASWDQADLADVTIGGAPLKHYTNLVFAGIEATSAPVDASAMTSFRLDLWTPDPTGTGVFRVKLVDFGANGTFGGGDDVEHELTFSASSVPALRTGEWVTLDIPLSAFTGLTTRAHVAQFIISGDLRTVYVGNVLFHK